MTTQYIYPMECNFSSSVITHFWVESMNIFIDCELPGTASYNQRSKETSYHWSGVMPLIHIPPSSLKGTGRVCERVVISERCSAGFSLTLLEEHPGVSTCSIWAVHSHWQSRATPEEVNLEDPLWGIGFPFPSKRSGHERKVLLLLLNHILWGGWFFYWCA